MRYAQPCYATRLGVDGLIYRKQTSKERHVGGANNWMPSVVLEGRVTRSIGALTRSDGNYDHSRFIEMYVHDAAYGYNESNIDTPSVVATAAGRTGARVPKPPFAMLS